ncbi:alpha/beta fold hydrolase [Aestuariivita boseongensis]|uniref:alpha/beta fold hydrolase n=1 Tax=Aestuariivita boseongensis TaxID=1470562 RepID=UPI0006807F4F|nr:alpha/beta hydrolase [Aestuariivita boseongensis]
MADPAPYYADVADGPADGAAFWAQTSDGLRVRIGVWPKADARGTLLLFPGRSEYVEKYARFASDVTAEGYAMMAIDWRGQGIADRLLPDRRIGHVGRFRDFQKDVAAMVALAQELDMPKPWHILGHSMGGAIALRSVMEGIDVLSASFTGPMWGILMAKGMRQMALALYYASKWTGQGHRLAPTATAENYILTSPFEGNTLTNTPEMWEYMKTQVTRYPDMALGGPSIHWLGEALRECRYLRRAAPPPVPAICFVGEDEAIVDREAMRLRMANWTGGSYQVVNDAQHEILMEGPETRALVLRQMLDLFERGESQANLPRSG